MKKILLDYSLRSIAIIVAILFVFVQTVHSKTVSLEDAKLKAQRFLYANHAKSLSFPHAISAPTFELAYEAKTASNSISCFYVLNQTPSEGYVIVSADDRLPDVLGYSDNGFFDLDNAPDNMKWLLSEYEQQIEYLLFENEANATMVATETDYREGWDEIQPMVTCKWDQDAPYNNLCPIYMDGQKTPTGCAATAMAQVMYYHKWPKTGRGSHSYEWSNGQTQQTLSMDFSKVTFDWENMQDTYYSNSNQIAQDAVATLMYACGISVDMWYTPSWSAAKLSDVKEALCLYFDYNAKYLKKENTPLPDWETLIYTELTNKRPVYYGGNSSEAGHAFVCDGYSHDGLFHINWGWGGWYDGYFLLNVLDPYEGFTGSEGDGYCNNPEIIYGIYPASNVIIEIDGIYYIITDERKAVVTIPNDGYYTGNLTIPQTITYEGEIYQVTEIPQIVWRYCQDLTSLTVYAPIDEFAYEYLNNEKSPNLRTVKLYDVNRISDMAFYGCNNLETLVLGENLETIGNHAFQNCNALTELIIPDKVRSIGDWAFDGCESLTKLTLGTNLENIGYCTFCNCNTLQELTIPDNVRFIDISAFYGCESLTKLTLGANLESIGSYAFYGCNNLETLVLGENLETVGDYAFQNCNALTALIIPNKVRSIGEWAFYGCESLTNLNLGTNLENIGYCAFYNCNTLQELTIPDKVKSIGDYAFYRCENLKTLKLGTNLETIGIYSFYWCPALTNLFWGDALKSIGNGAFYNCSSLTELIVPYNVKSIGKWAFYYCRNLTNLQLSEAVETIGNGAFYMCWNLPELIIPNHVKSIGDESFRYGANLKKIVIPNSVETIGDYAFYEEGTYGIRTIISQIEEPFDLYENTFTATAFARDELQVPYGTIEKYRAKDVWKNFDNIMEFIPTIAVSVGNEGIATYCPANDVDFSSATKITAYKATVREDNVVVLTKVETVAAGEGVLLRSLNGNATTEALPVVNGVTKNTDNAFVGVLEETILHTVEGDVTNFVLSKVEDIVGFYKANNTNVGAGKAYLPIKNYSPSASVKRLTIVFDDECVTDINEISVQQESDEDAVYYTLTGTPVKKPTKKGIYICNGKKVIIK